MTVLLKVQKGRYGMRNAALRSRPDSQNPHIRFSEIDKVWSYEALAEAAEAGGSCGVLDVSSDFMPRPYKTELYDLTTKGFPVIPGVGVVDLKNYTAQSPWHTHRGCIEFILCRRGLLRYESGGTTYEVPPGGIFVSRENESHRQVSTERCIKYFMLKVSCRRGDWERSGFSAEMCRWFVSAFDLNSSVGHFADAAFAA